MSERRLPATQFLDGLAPFEWPLANAHLSAAIGRVGDHRNALLASEREALADMSAVRAVQYSSGRRVARVALSSLGFAGAAVPRRGRLPAWPAGTVGSLAHSRSLAAALVGRASRFAGVGVDAELGQRVHERLAGRVLTASERRWPLQGDAATLLFSAKEAIYKAVHPLVGEYLGFQDVEVALGDDGCYAARTTRPCASTGAVEAGEGFYASMHGHWLTVFVLPLAGR